MKTSLSLRAFLNAAGTFAYITVIALFMSRASDLFGAEDTALTPVFALTLFVVSAFVTGLLVLGKPIMLYIDGERRDALKLLITTVAWLAVFLVAVGVSMIVLR